MVKFSQLQDNDTLIDAIQRELPQSTFYWLLISLIAAMLWIVYLTYYNCRVVGFILTAICNRFVKFGHLRFGSFSFSVLSGKIMFRDVHLVTEDYSMRIQLGMAIFRWWRPITYKTINEDLIHEETRVTFYLDSFELHVYNRSNTYARLEEMFGLEKGFIPSKKDDKDKDKKKDQTADNTESPKTNKSWLWRMLVPVIKVEISSGRIVFGNHLLPTTLSVNFGDSHFLYSTKQASTPFDQYMHIVKGKTDNIRIMLVPSPKYQPPPGVNDEPPRYMGDGFVVLQSQKVDLYYFHDEPGLVPIEPESLQMANGDIVSRRTWPVWGVEVKCDKMTDISYGPWADRQREYLWKFFFPPDYQTMKVTSLPEPGQVRMWKNFDFKMSLQGDATIDILFTKNKETQAIHMNAKKGSYLEFTIPWVTEEQGYMTKISGLLIALDTSTSLSYRSLIQCETLEVDVEAQYPRHWNEHQNWKCDIRASKASGSLTYQHKHFFSDLVDDWSSKSRSDLFHFVPYTWKVNLILQEFELITVTNEWNWIDCHGKTPENALIAVCGDTFDLSFSLPFFDYLPTAVPIKLFIRGEGVEVRLYLPETNASRHLLLALAKNALLLGRDGNITDVPIGGEESNKWRRLTKRSQGWVDGLVTPIVALSVNYSYHPSPNIGEMDRSTTMESMTTPDAEEMLLVPLRLHPLRPLRKKKVSETSEFDPSPMEPDKISVELEVGPSEICVYGALLRNLWHIKENYFGDDQKFTDFKQTFESKEKESTFEHILTNDNKKPFDARRYRPLHIQVQVTLHDMHGHLMKNCSEGDPPCPSVFIESLSVELDKHYTETKLQVIFSPAIIYVRDNYQERPDVHGHLKDGHLMLTALQIRGNALFSHKGLPLDTETLEYAWLLEVTIGDLIGRLTAPQLQTVIEFLQTLASGIEDAENGLQRPTPYKLCQHSVPQAECKAEPKYNFPCLTPDDIKYRMTRVTMDCVDLYLVESGSALNVQVYPIRMSTCNLHGKNNKAGITALVPNVKIKQFVLSVPVDMLYNTRSDVWLEAGGVSFGPINVDSAMALPGPEFHPMQDRFLKLHDEKTKRLWFLWPKDDLPKFARAQGKCGCVGGCTFFGVNRNGPLIFHPTERDFIDSTNAAVFHICKDDMSFGFGQSLLQREEFIFNAHSGLTGFPVTPSKSQALAQQSRAQQQGLWGSKASVNTSQADTVNTSSVASPSTIASSDLNATADTFKPDDSFRSESTLVGSIADSESVRGKPAVGLPATAEEPLNIDRRSQRSPSIPTSDLTSLKSDSIPSEYIPDGSIPDCYDTDRYISTPSDAESSWPPAGSGSVNSLPDIVVSSKEKGHVRKFSDPPLRHPQKTKPEDLAMKEGGSVHSSLSTESQKSSYSLETSGMNHSRQSSLTSPVLRRLSSQLSFPRDGSTASMTGSGSDRFYSCVENLTDSVHTLNSLTTGSEATSPMGTLHRPRSTKQGSISSDNAAKSPRVSLYSIDGESLSSSYAGDIDSPRSSMYTHRERSESESSCSSSASATSFVSALSSQRTSRHSIQKIQSGSSSMTINGDEDELLYKYDSDHDFDMEEDLLAASNYVNLHGQINQPITKSVLLTNCYMNHMTHLQCSHWTAPPPLPGHMLAWKPPGGTTDTDNSQNPATSPVLSNNMQNTDPTWIPHYSYLNQGFTPGLMVNKREMKSPPDLSTSSTSEVINKPRRFFPSDEDISPDSESMFTYENHISKTTAIVNLKGSIDIMVSPLMLEALQRYVEAVTPVLQNLHPSTIVDALHFKCTSIVKAQNKLKQKTEGDVADQADGKKTKTKGQGQSAEEKSGDEKESKTSRLQVMFSLSRVNICLLQASLVEEMISIAALDNASDLTCVSVLAACFDNISCQLLMNNISQKALEPILYDSSPESTARASMAFPPPNPSLMKKQASMASENTETEQLVERQQEDMVGSLSIERIHFQLRRMKKKSNYSSSSVYLTAIPEYRSKVLFTFETPPMGDFTGTGTLTPMKPSVTSQGSDPEPLVRDFDSEGLSAEDIAGFIMFECGLEDISLKAARRTGYAGKASPQDEEYIQHVNRLLEDARKRTEPKQTPDKEGEGHTNLDSDIDSNSKSQDSEDGNSADDEASIKSEYGSSSSVDSLPNDDTKSGTKASSQRGSRDDTTCGEDLDQQDLQGDASSGVLKVSSVWFNFAAPPPSPKKKKLEYTRYDWNLLSTATPAINAWMNPCHRAIMAAKTLVLKLNERVCVVMACMMTEGPETSGIHIKVKSKFNKLTSLSSTLQEDPSCQLLNSLRRYIRKVGVNVIEESVNVDTIPQLVTIKKGLLVMTRQWKNVIYMPRQATEHNFKSKRKVPYNVNFTLPPHDKSLDHMSTTATANMDDIETMADNFEVVDEKTSLLKAEGGSIHQSASGFSVTGSAHNIASPKMTEESKHKNLMELPSLSQTPVPNKQPAHRQASNASQLSGSVNSLSSIEQFGTAASAPGTPRRQSLTRHLSELEREGGKDVDQWMQQQQQYMAGQIKSLNYYPSMGQDSLMNAGLSEYSHDESMSLAPFITHPLVQIQDAQVLFKPLLQSMGLHTEAVKMSAIMKKFGGNISVRSQLQQLRIEIVDSDSTSSHKVKGKGKGKGRKLPKFVIDTGLDKPAFQTDALAFMVDMKDIVDFEKPKEENPEPDISDLRRKSLRTLKFAIEHMEAKPTTTRVNCSFNCNSVTQHVNMSLLRLIHQFVTMIENIQETRTELKAQIPPDMYRRHKKQDSKGSSTETGTDVHSLDHLEVDRQVSDPSVSVSSPVSDIQSPTQRPSNLPLSDLGQEKKPRPDRLPLGGGFSSKTPRRHSGKKAKGEALTPKSPEAGTVAEDPLLTSPIHSIDSVTIDMADTSSPAIAEKTIVDQIRENTPVCWIKLYHIINYYHTIPEIKTVTKKQPAHSRLSVIDEEPEKGSQNQSSTKAASHDSEKPVADADTVERQPVNNKKMTASKLYARATFTHSLMIGGERIPLIVFGTARIKRIKITAVLSGLTLEADLQNVHGSTTHRERVKGVPKKRSHETSATAHVGHTMIALIEGNAPDLQTVVTINISKSQGLYSSITKRSHEHNSGLLTVGKIDIDIPQHPVALHGMVARSSKRLSNTLQEFIRVPARLRSFDTPDSMPTQQPSRHSDLNEFINTSAKPQDVGQAQPPGKPEAPSVPLVIHFKAILKGLTVGASLLPSLKAEYKMGRVFSTGVTGKKAKFTIDLPTHSLSFESKVTTPSSMPSSANVVLPPIHLHADYKELTGHTHRDTGLAEGLTIREGPFLNAVAEVGAFEHSLTTDLLNHLVFVQKVFMKEVNEVVQKVSGGDQPVPLWHEESVQAPKTAHKPMLYHFWFRLKGIQITATTPTDNAVRLETDMIELQLSNRVLRARREKTASDKFKVFVKAQVDLRVALGTLMKNPLFNEAEPDFPQLASFDTRISLRNALQDEMIPGVSKDQEALLISLKRPIIFVQPAAFDKAVLVWLNYKNAYEYWNEQRMVLNKEVQTAVNKATQQFMERLPLGPISQPSSSQALGTLFLQLTVDDLGICLPTNPFSQGMNATNKMLEEPGASLVLTLEQTQISACSCGSLVSKGTFTGFCLRFDEDFEKSWDDWKPSRSQKIVMNAMVVPEGTYEVCSRTINPQNENSNAKVILNVKWQMRGIDVHLDPNIGKRLSVLGNTLTSLAWDTTYEGYIPEDGAQRIDTTRGKVDAPTRKSNVLVDELLDAGFTLDNLDSKQWTRLIENKMNEQAKAVEDLKQLGASHDIVEAEERKLHELKAAVCHDFRQDIIKKLRRKSVKASALKDKLGLGYKPSHVRSKSYGISGSRSNYRRPTTLDTRRLISYQEESENDLSPTSPGGRPRRPKHNRAMSLDIEAMSTPKVSFDRSPLSIHHEFLSTSIDDPGHFVDGSSPETPSTPPYLNLQDQSSSSDNNEDEGGDPDLAFHRKAAVRMRERANSDSQKEKVPSPSQGSGGSGSKATMEPSVDFELDVKVDIDSGMCVLHPKESKLEGEPTGVKGGRSQRDLQQVSPRSERRNKRAAEGLPPNRSYSKLYQHDSLPGSRALQPPPISNTTTFFIPGLDVKVQWSSKTSKTESGGQTEAEPDPFDTPQNNIGSGNSLSSAKKSAQKKANLYAWLSLQQLPEEMLISPVILDFLEQALEPIPMMSSKNSSKNSTIRPTPASANTIDLDTSAASLVSTGNYSSFPVDVVVYIRVQPSLIRFTCLPVSRVECLLRLPSLDVVFSTKKADQEIMSETSPPKAKASRLGSTASSMGLRPGLAPNRTRSTSTHQEATTVSGGGLSVTACLADFSLYVFHPYGGGQKKTSLTALENRFKKSRGSTEDGYSQVTDAGRKDSLSLNVEFVKVNLSRSRKGVLQSDMPPGGSSGKLSSLEAQAAKAANSVRFSAVCDIGSASFKYDMRRLSEILALPKAWYRRALARRMFLGEETAVVDSEEEVNDDSSSSSPTSPDSPLFSPYGRAQTFNTVHYPMNEAVSANHRRAASTGTHKTLSLEKEFKRDFREYCLRQQQIPGAGSAPQTPAEAVRVTQARTQPSTPSMLPPRVQLEYMKLRERDFQAFTKAHSQYVTQGTPGMSGSGKSVRDWETLVLFAVNLSQLDVAVNMSNVMGNTVWSTRDLKSEGSVSMDSTGAKSMVISAGLSSSRLEAKGGIVGGNIELQKLSTSVSIKEEPHNEPEHRVGIQLQALETRLDYMGSSILMGRTSSLSVCLRDEWKIQACRMDDSDPDMVATRRPATIFIYCDLDWDKVHLMISRSTTPDLIKMVTKLEEFFAQQLHSSKRVLFAFGPKPGSNKTKKKDKEDEVSWISEIRHHRHWQRVLDLVSGCKLSMLSFTLPSHRSTVGGSMSIRGRNLSLACFHGINFRSKSWGLFTMDEPFITFTTEAQEVVDDDGAKCTHVEQSLQFRLGHEHRDQREMDRKDMAMVCKLSRGHYMPPPMTNVQEWFHYAFATSEIRDLDSFPQMTRGEGSDSPPERRVTPRRGQDYNHETEVIFVLPCLLMVLKTRHLQGEHEPAEDDPKPKVDCSFVTDFYHHINVAMDAEAILFIHDLVTSYVREKDKGAGRAPRSPEQEKKNVSNPTTVLKQDYREFVTQSWRLEPTVNLLTWAGKKIDPVGVDFILQKLGFQHARLTIPKWMQRGCMDPLDKVLSVLVDKLIILLKENADKEKDREMEDIV